MGLQETEREKGREGKNKLDVVASCGVANLNLIKIFPMHHDGLKVPWAHGESGKCL